MQTQSQRETYVIPSRVREISKATSLQRECIYTFAYSNEASRIDSNSMQIVNVMEASEKIKHVGRVYNILT